MSESFGNEFFGVVRDGKFQPLETESAVGVSLRFTSQPLRMADPERGELDLSQYEGKAVLIHGVHDSDWVYYSQVIDAAGAILTMVVQRLFGQGYRSA